MCEILLKRKCEKQLITVPKLVTVVQVSDFRLTVLVLLVQKYKVINYLV